jgi:hypothetical protein
MERTKEQITKFWEWCGFRFVPQKESMRFGGKQDYWDTQNYYITPKNTKRHYLPTISIDNIFKYAIPKLQQEGNIIELTALECNSFECRIGSVMDASWSCGIRSDNAIEALFNAIYEVIENEIK